MTAAPYCPDAQCVEDECGPTAPCCISICGCSIAQDHCAYAKNTGNEFEDLDGTNRDIWYCPEHKTEWLK
jgi:hypothetical protein